MLGLFGDRSADEPPILTTNKFSHGGYLVTEVPVSHQFSHRQILARGLFGDRSTDESPIMRGIDSVLREILLNTMKIKKHL